MTSEKAGWYMGIIAACQGMADELELSDYEAQKFREFVLNMAKEQFKEGNRSGLAWARKNPRPCEACPDPEKVGDRVRLLAFSLGCSSVVAEALKRGAMVALEPKE